MRDFQNEKVEEEEEENTTNTCARSTISPALPPGREKGKSKLHKADICHSDSTQIVDYCFD